MVKKLFPLLFVFLFLQSLPIFAEQSLKPTWYDIKYNTDYKGYVAENKYEKSENVRDRTGATYTQKKILYTVFTVESGPHMGVQLFCNHVTGKNIAKEFPDSYIEPKGEKYYVYDYEKYLIYHNLKEERMVIP